MAINHTVRSILTARARANSKRRKRADNFHLALVIECGGMRGVAAGGIIQALSEAKLLDSFDTLHGSSSGACAAAYFLTEQIEEGRKILHVDICTRKIVNPWRLLSRPSMVDTDYIVDEIVAAKRRLDTERIIAESGVLNIVTTSVADGLPVVHKNFANSEQILGALRATLRVPGPFECGIEIGGAYQLDGGLVAPIPMFSAINSGATHALVVCTQRVQDYTSSKIRNHVESLMLGAVYGSRLREAYFVAQCVDRRIGIVSCPPTIKVDILTRPEDSTYCGWFTIDKGILKDVEREAIHLAEAYLKEGSVEASTQSS
jgi:predicted patatin/cPLA2 family phospholipase